MTNIDKFKRAVWVVIRKFDAGPLLLRWYPKSYLRKIGWFRSFREWRPVTISGEPLPWLNYGLLHILENRVNQNMRVFEFGVGYSTLWFSKRVKAIVGVEHNPKWAKQITEKLPSNGIVIFTNNTKDYAKEVLNHGLFDIILVDGIIRNECIEKALYALSPIGVIILDNAERKEYESSKELLLGQGFKEIPFIGLTPGEFIFMQTSVFYKNGNCLEI